LSFSALFVLGVAIRLILPYFVSGEPLNLRGVLKNIVTFISKFVNFLLFAASSALTMFLISQCRVESISVTMIGNRANQFYLTYH